MLAVTRKVGQEVEIWHRGELLRLRVVESAGGAVRLGFEGPLSFVVLRDDAKCRHPMPERAFAPPT